ncbi:DDE-type integrase/transposase/recombinase [Anaerobium acetethylicum]|uniref:Transposase (Or an inactivated derivative) n=1 Tax=Anaerobium acetethylicum TaxID=1619234 RepID=A0A1D3TRA2_9FIRM|nr:DDE-type integrase/transposase/recombinase [Anaerobium acetethylicum]SCP96198.1 Transposase (or an inactivated derivative) [Anaerobium acetethylicum]
MDIILYLLQLIQYLYQQNCWLLNFICRYIPLKQWAFDDSHSPKYQKFKTDELPVIICHKQDWDWNDLLNYYQQRYHKILKPVNRRKECDIPEDCHCPSCKAPMPYLYRNNGSKGQILCKVCQTPFSPEENRFEKQYSLKCPHCSHSLAHKKDRKHFILHKCVNPKCTYYLNNLKKIDKAHLEKDYGKNEYKLHYLYREFTIDFFRMDLNSLPKNASSLKFSKHNAYIMFLCLTMHVNLQLSLRKTAQALKDLYGIEISHQQVANYARTAALVIKPFADTYDYQTKSVFTADETYIKVRGVKGYIWFIMDAVSRSIIGYRVSDNRGVGPCILAMRMAFRNLKELPENFKFIADGYSAYPLAAQQFFHEFGDKFKFDITQVIGLSNNDEVSKEFRPYKQMIERLNRTFKSSYRVSCGYDNYEGANYNVALWVAYYNFLRPHKHNGYQVLNKVDLLEGAGNMPGKWQLLILLGQQAILKMQAEGSNCS